MSSSLSDVEDQPTSANACFHYIPSKSDSDNNLLHHSNPESSFYVVKNPQQSSPFSSSTTTTISRPGNARTLFTIIPPMPQDTATKINVRCRIFF
jgi:hypothetical protein